MTNHRRFYLDRSCQPLDRVDLDLPATGHPTTDEEPDPDGCSPWSCRSGTRVDQPRAA